MQICMKSDHLTAWVILVNSKFKQKIWYDKRVRISKGKMEGRFNLNTHNPNSALRLSATIFGLIAVVLNLFLIPLH